MADPTCPICRLAVPKGRENPAFPFCSDRCKVIDLGKWLSGDYRIPVEEDDEAVPTERGSGGDTIH